MSPPSLHSDEDQDSLFGSPPPSPARGRSPSEEISISAEESHPAIAVPSTGVVRKNVGTIALPGSHMSCAELPANLPASSLSLSHHASSHNSQCIAPSGVSGTPASSSTRPVPSRVSSSGAVPSTSAPSSRRRTSKAKSLTPIPPAPPIALPRPNEPPPPNFLRSQSSLLGLAGLVGCVKPAQLHTQHDPQPSPVQPFRSHSLPRGSTPAHPIVLDDDEDTPGTGKCLKGQLQMPEHLDQLNPEILRSNIISSLAKEKNIFPLLKSLIRLFGGEPYPPADPLSQPFSRPYGHGIFSAQSSSSAATSFFPSNPTSGPTVPSSKRRKLKHVPAGAVDWDVPFPFEAGEGPEAYRDTWALDRAKHVVAQLLELIQNATKRAAITTARSRGKSCKRQTSAGGRRSSRSTSIEAQIAQTNPGHANVCGALLYTGPSLKGAETETSSDIALIDHLNRPHLGPLETQNTIGSRTPSSEDETTAYPEGVVEEGGPAAPWDDSTLADWLSQLRQFAPPETAAPLPESDWGARSSASLDSPCSTPPLDMCSQMHDTLTTSHAPHAPQAEVIDPALLAISQQAEPALQSQSPIFPASRLTSADGPQMIDISTNSPELTLLPGILSSSPIDQATPLSEALIATPTSTIAHKDLVRGSFQPIEKDHRSRPAIGAQTGVLSPSPGESFESLQLNVAKKGKARADDGESATPSMWGGSSLSSTSTSKGALVRQAILERARERRRQLVAEIERVKMEIWETSIENAVLVHLTR